MEKKRLLIITQELEPYTEDSDISRLVAKLPKFLQDNGYELRILMPRYGVVNERRHRLHEVVRLSGMNIIVDDDDYPLIIKVASLPGSRLQVYFLDNEDFFRRKLMFSSEDGQPFEDNPDRAAFFCKGAIETVKKIRLVSGYYSLCRLDDGSGAAVPQSGVQNRTPFPQRADCVCAFSRPARACCGRAFF